MPFFEKLQDMYIELERWQICEHTTKNDVIKNCRSRVAVIISELLAAPHVGIAFAHPSDTLRLDHFSCDPNVNKIVFKSDECVEKRVADSVS
jgi:hypothetical protein